jgi:hypothetical protein
MTKTHIVPQKLAVNFLNNLLDVVLDNPNTAPKGFSNKLAKKVCLALKAKDFCNKIVDADIGYDEEESGVLSALTPHLHCLYNKNPTYRTFLVSLNYKTIVPKNNHTPTLTKTPFWPPPEAADVDQKLRLFCDNMLANGGKLDLATLRSKAQQMVG